MSRTRGGNWVEKYRPQPVEPITAIICQNSDVHCYAFQCLVRYLSVILFAEHRYFDQTSDS